MLANVHAVMILAGLVLPLGAAAASPAWRPRAGREVVLGVAPLIAIGLMCSLLRSGMGAPVAEWAFPSVGVAIGGLFVKSEQAWPAIRWGLLGLAAVLCLNAMALRQNGYASYSAVRVFQGVESAWLAALRARLQHQFAAEKELPAGRVSTFLVGEESLALWNKNTLQPVWHTPFTGLYRIEETAGEAWYPGGTLAGGCPRIEWRPLAQPGK